MTQAPASKITMEQDLASRLATRGGEGTRTLEECFREIAFLTLLLREREELEEPQSQQRSWLCELAVALLMMPRWWGMMPRSWRKRKMRTFLKQSGLFDGDDYLERNPDVAATGADPLRHYLQHGIREGRARSA